MAADRQVPGLSPSGAQSARRDSDKGRFPSTSRDGRRPDEVMGGLLYQRSARPKVRPYEVTLRASAWQLKLEGEVLPSLAILPAQRRVIQAPLQRTLWDIGAYVPSCPLWDRALPATFASNQGCGMRKSLQLLMLMCCLPGYC